jgi:hypothetical protein
LSDVAHIAQLNHFGINFLLWFHFSELSTQHYDML